MYIYIFKLLSFFKIPIILSLLPLDHSLLKIIVYSNIFVFISIFSITSVWIISPELHWLFLPRFLLASSLLCYSLWNSSPLTFWCQTLLPSEMFYFLSSLWYAFLPLNINLTCELCHMLFQFSSVTQSCLTLCDPMDCSTPGFLSITNSQSLLKPMSIELVMPSNHLILCRPLLLLPPIPPSIRVFSNESVLHIRWPKYWSFSFSISPSNEYSGLISFRMDWLDLLHSKGLSRVFSNTTVQKHHFFGAQFSL